MDLARLEHALLGRLRHACSSQNWDLPLTANLFSGNYKTLVRLSDFSDMGLHSNTSENWRLTGHYPAQARFRYQSELFHGLAVALVGLDQ
jgi:hypothetical protein